MNQLAGVKEQLFETYQGMVQSVIAALPLVITGIILLLVAWLVAKIVERVLRAVLVRAKFDSLLQRVGIDKLLSRIGLRQSLNVLIPRMVYFLLLFLFLQTAMDALGLKAVSEALDAFFAYLPNLVAAVLLIMVGSAAARFAGQAVARAAQDSGIDYASSLGGVVSGLILFVIGIMAVGQLKIDTEIVRLVTVCTLAGLALAFGLSFGLGTREVTRNIIAGFYARRIFNAGDEIEIRGERGTLEAITPTQTILRQPQRRIAVSNAVFLDETVRQ